MLAASHWYTSGGFLALVGIVITLFVGVLGAWITYRVGTVRYRLFYSLPAVTSLLAAPSGPMRKDIKVTHLGTELNDPYILKIRLISRSRADLPSSAFDQDRPMVLDVGLPIISLLPTDENKDPLPKIERDASTLKIGPDLIGKRQEMIFAVLVDGDGANINGESHLVNGKLLAQPSDKQLRSKARRITAAFAILTVVFYGLGSVTHGTLANAFSFLLLAGFALTFISFGNMKDFLAWRYM